MSVHITWNSNPAPVASYLVQRGATSTGSFSTIGTASGSIPGANWDGTFFYYDDAAGTSASWYKLIAVDSLGNQSSPSDAFQAHQAADVTPPETVDYKTSKGTMGKDGTVGSSVYPVGGYRSATPHAEPIITPEQLKERFLFGIPLLSVMKDPLTGRRATMGDALLQDIIRGAVSDAETEAKCCIWPVQFNEKYQFDRSEYLSFGYFQLNNKPVTSIDEFHVTPANQMDVFDVPLDWVETANLTQGQLNICPIGIALNGTAFGGGVVGGVGAGAAAFLAILAQQAWIPAFWRIVYTSGYPDGMVPRYVNDLVGTIAAIKVLGMIGATHATVQSSSLGIDGFSQSVSTPGPNVYATRIQQLMDEKKRYLKTMKKMIGSAILVGNV